MQRSLGIGGLIIGIGVPISCLVPMFWWVNVKVLVDALIQKDIVWTFSMIVLDRWIVSSSSSHACALLLCVKSVCGILQYYVHWPLRITEPISARRQNSKLSQWKLLFSTKINILWVVSTIVRRSGVREAGEAVTKIQARCSGARLAAHSY